AADPALAPAWATLTNGVLRTCTDAFAGVCYQVRTTTATQPGNPYATSMEVSVTAVTACPHARTDHVDTTGCISDTLHQQLRQRQFFDYLYFDELETLDPVLYSSQQAQARAADVCAALAPSRPSDCAAVPFLGPVGGSGGDVVAGPIHTN